MYDNLHNQCARFEKLASSVKLIAYRSAENFDFSPSSSGSLGPGYYFTTSLERARKYATVYDYGGYAAEVEITFSNPLTGPKLSMAEELGLLNHIEEDTGAFDFEVGKQLSLLAAERGYDGIVATVKDGVSFEIVAFDLNSVKPIRIIAPEGV